jgi:hypothetical protein
MQEIREKKNAHLRRSGNARRARFLLQATPDYDTLLY